MVYLFYLVIALLVVLLSVKASDYVDIIDKKTDLSGAFIGGVMLSAVTSLPELFTSISSTVMLGEPGLCIGNILGSNLFNLAALSVVALFCARNFRYALIARSQFVVAIATAVGYLAIVLNYLGVVCIEVCTISVTSVILLAAYIFGVKNMAGDIDTPDLEDDASPLSLRQVVVRFVLVSIGIIATSIILTYLTDDISDRLNLGEGLAGALFLGVATSLPELSSTISLFRKRNYNVAIGNIIGSNLFNFVILTVADVLYIGGGIFDFSDPKTVSLLFFGCISTLFAMLLLKWKSNFTSIVCPAVMAACYVGFLLL